MGSKLEISPYLFNHHYGFQQTLKYSPLLPVSEFGKFEITIIDQSDASLRNRTFGHGRTIETLTAPSGVLSADYKQNTCDLLSRGKKKPVLGGFTNSRCFDKFVSSCHQQFSLQGEEKMAENGDEAGRIEGKDRFD